MMDLKKQSGPLLCLLGLWLALTASAKPPPQQGGWPDTLPYAAGGFVMALVGVGLWRRRASRTRMAGAEGWEMPPGHGSEEHARLWTLFLEAFQSFHTALPSMTLPEILDRLIHLQDRFILPLSQARMVFFVASDTVRGWGRLTAFSRGELWMNRAQTTAGDEHREETLAALAWARESFLEVQNAFSEA